MARRVKLLRTFGFGLIAAALAGCADPSLPLGSDFGNAVAANIAAQVVNPAPNLGGVAPTDGQRMETAVERYRTNKVYQPRRSAYTADTIDQATQQQ